MPPFLLAPTLLLIFSTFSPPVSPGNGGLGSVCYSSSLLHFPPQGEYWVLFPLFPSCTGESPPQTSPACVIPTGCNSLWTTPVWVPSTGSNPSGTGCCSVGLPHSHKPCQKICFKTGFPLGYSLLSGIHLLQSGIPAWAAGRSLLLQGSSWAAGTELPHHGLHHQNLCSGAWATSSPFFTDLSVGRSVPLIYSHSSLQLHLVLHRFFPSLPKHLIPRMPLPLLLSSALASGVELAGCVGHRASS